MDNACPIIAVGLMLALFTMPVAQQARRRGYSLGLWLLAGIAVVNPIIFLIMLAIMPNRRRLRQREQFRAELMAKLAALPAGASPAAHHPAARGAIDRSLGDLPTVVPPERSLGDFETMG